MQDDEISKEYRRMLRRERYLAERDKKNCLSFYGYEDELYYRKNIAGEYFSFQQEAEIEQLQLRALRLALSDYKKISPCGYALIKDYYLRDKMLTYTELAKLHGQKRQSVTRKLKRHVAKLKILAYNYYDILSK